MQQGVPRSLPKALWATGPLVAQGRAHQAMHSGVTQAHTQQSHAGCMQCAANDSFTNVTVS